MSIFHFSYQWGYSVLPLVQPIISFYRPNTQREKKEFESSTSLASWPTPGISPLLVSSKAACRLTLNQVAQLGETELLEQRFIKDA